MNRKIILVICALYFLSMGALAKIIEVAPADARMTTMIVGGGTAAAADPCAAAWSDITSPEWTYDADHTTDDLYACLDGGTSTESGDIDTALCTPGTVSLGSGGQAICAASGTIQFDNGNSAVDFRQGEVSGTFWITNTSATASYIVRLISDDNRLDLILLGDEAGFIISIYDHTPDTTYTGSTTTGDLTAYVNTYWIDFVCQWDQSRSTGDEVTCKTQVQDGTPTWTAWGNSTDADTFSFAAAENPGANQMDFGANAANNHNIEIDDIAFRSTISSWEF